MAGRPGIFSGALETSLGRMPAFGLDDAAVAVRHDPDDSVIRFLSSMAPRVSGHARTCVSIQKLRRF